MCDTPSYVFATPGHGNHGGADDVLHEATEKGLAGQISVVLLCKCALHIEQLESHQVVSLLLKTLDDFTHEAALHACVWET